MFFLVLWTGAGTLGCSSSTGVNDEMCNVDSDCPASDRCLDGACRQATFQSGDGDATDAGVSGDGDGDGDATTCVARCGASDGGCACDAGCLARNDCCSDFITACPAQTPCPGVPLDDDEVCAARVDACTVLSSTTCGATCQALGVVCVQSDVAATCADLAEAPADCITDDEGQRCTCAAAPDADMDGIADSVDRCPEVADASNADGDGDGDGVGDVCDCADADGDGYGMGPGCLGADCNDQDEERFRNVVLYVDGDNDGATASAAGSVFCIGGTTPPGYSSMPSSDDDCDDMNPAWGVPQAAFTDGDGDSFGDPEGSILTCGPVPDGFVLDNTDCNDFERDAHPGAEEQCDGLDWDCDGAAATPDTCGCTVVDIDVDVDEGDEIFVCGFPRTWPDALAQCHWMGRSLLTIDAPGLQDGLDERFSTLYPEVTAQLWIGLSDRDDEGTFAWSDMTPTSYTAWGPGEPNAASANEDCVEFRSRGFGWSDAGCNLYKPSLCGPQL